MPTLYVRRFNLKDSLSDTEVVDYWKFLQEEFIPMSAAVTMSWSKPLRKRAVRA